MKSISLTLILFGFISCGNSNNTHQESNTTNTTENIVSEQPIEAAQEVEATKEEELVTEVTEEETVESLKPETSSPKPQTPNKKPVTEAKPQPTIEETLPEPEKEIVVNDKPNHQAWDELAKKYVTANGKVNYNGFKSELDKLKKYIDYLGENPVKSTWSKNEELAYWFNLYNASTVYLIASNYPTSSITKLEKGKPWDKKFIKSGDKTYSLNDIENVIVRPKFNEPLVHVAFNCAAVSCPILLNEAFVAEKLTTQLTKQAKNWVNDASKNELSADKIKVSQIFDWYKADFDKVGGVIGFINKYSTTKINENAKISYLEYNWNLNE
ncbi:MAG: DUF547 domain-containing protein [Vicingaceae bacterium]|nr:DUF547 domain-containing protein [Vicingaceae bacterium]